MFVTNKYMGKKVFIVGNGFDLDLGLHTSYREFAQCDFWPIKEEDCKKSFLAQRLEKDKKENWFDLENSLLDYAQIATDYSEKQKILLPSYYDDKQTYLNVKNALFKFVSNHELLKAKKESMSAKVLEVISSNAIFDIVLSFNYTDLGAICEKLGYNKIRYKHVHGSCADNSIILGVASNYELKQDYDYLYKAFDTYYRSPNVRYALQNVEDVVFYGHSLGRQDFDYFQDFFMSCCKEGMKQEDSVNITFFTKDEDSELQLKRQLRSMISEGYGRLVDGNKVRFIHSTDMESGDFVEFLERMRDIQIDNMRKRNSHGIRIRGVDF